VTEHLEFREIADAASAGCIFYDADCRFCLRLANRYRPHFAKRGFAVVPIQAPSAQRRLAKWTDTPLTEMHVVTAAGEHFAGANAVIFLAGTVWWGRPLYLIAKFPRGEMFLNWFYRWVAAHRSCAGAIAHRSPI
jgi:predicted DCC family thiol-disulfide oxidoreductase YuxK